MDSESVDVLLTDHTPAGRVVCVLLAALLVALFVLGQNFRVESTTEDARFVVSEDVRAWQEKDEWEFEFAELQENLHNVNPENRETTISVTSLHPNIADNFALDNFKTRLAEELSSAHETSISRGLAITFNGIPLQVRPLALLHSDQIIPAYQELTYDGHGAMPVTVRIYAGVAASEPSDAGWYVYCNGRMILEHDKTAVTGWGEDGEKAVARYHNQYARFRGFTFFDSDDAARLPWNTTKTGVVADSPMYQSVRLKMIEMMRPVIAFLNKLKEERAQGEEDEESDSLRAVVEAAQTSRLDEVSTNQRFLAPKPVKRPRLPATGHIQYSKPLDEIKRVKRSLGVSTNKDDGEKTFEYFLRMECED